MLTIFFSARQTVVVNGTAASFKVLTANFIRVIEPAGKSSSRISVTNAGG